MTDEKKSPPTPVPPTPRAVLPSSSGEHRAVREAKVTMAEVTRNAQELIAAAGVPTIRAPSLTAPTVIPEPPELEDSGPQIEVAHVAPEAIDEVLADYIDSNREAPSFVPPPPPPPPGRPVVLIIDDEPDIRDGVADLLGDFGLQCITAVHGLDGMNKLDACEPPPACILLDMRMPKYDGFSFLGMFDRTDFAGIVPVLLISNNRYPDHGHEHDPQWVTVDRKRKRGEFIGKNWGDGTILVERVQAAVAKGIQRQRGGTLPPDPTPG